MSFWDIVWLTPISFAFMAYLMAMFTILSDLFRDPKASGFAKAVWIIALIFLPFIATVVYLIAEGKDMGERQVRSVEQGQAQQDAYTKQVAGSAAPTEQIAQATSMLDSAAITSGAFTPAEYERLEEKALA